MIFQHTLERVLDGTKTQTSRIWKDSYEAWYGLYHTTMQAVVSLDTERTVYEVGKTYAVQPARGKHGVARIRITALEKRSVHTFTDEDYARERLAPQTFKGLWAEMHGWNDMALVIRFELVQP